MPATNSPLRFFACARLPRWWQRCAAAQAAKAVRRAGVRSGSAARQLRVVQQREPPAMARRKATGGVGGGGAGRPEGRPPNGAVKSGNGVCAHP